MGLIETKQEQATEHDCAILAVLAEAGDAAVPVGQLAETTGIKPRTLTDRIAVLRERGLVGRRGERGPVFITSTGRIEAGAGRPALNLGAALDEALVLLPSEAHRAMLRLMLSGTVARHHLLDRYPYGWPGFIGLGGTAECKTVLARIVCRIFGIPERRAVRLVRAETPGSLLGRRYQKPGGIMAVEPSPLVELPFLALDELDKADPPQMRAALALLQGDAEADLEGDTIMIRPCVYVLLNTGPEGLGVLPDSYVRRCVVLDTGVLGALLEDADEAGRAVLAPGVLPRMSLDDLTPPAEELPDQLRTWLRTTLKTALTAHGWKLTDVESLARLALGRAALTPASGLTVATAATCFDYLTVAETLGHTAPGWPGMFRQWLDRAADAGNTLLPDPARAMADAAHRQDAERTRHAQQTAESVALAADRVALAETLRQAASRLDGRCFRATWQTPFRPQAARLRAALLDLATRVAESRSRDSLDDLSILGRDWIGQAQDLLNNLDAAEQNRNRVEQAAKQSKAIWQSRAATLRQERARVVEQARKLEKLWKRTGTPRGRTVLEELTTLRIDGTPLLTFTQGPLKRPGIDVALEILDSLGKIAAAYAGNPVASDESPRRHGQPGTWHITGTDLALDGYADHCDQLTTWSSPMVRAVLGPTLTALHTAEDQINAALGTFTTRTRPETRAVSTTALTTPRQAATPQPKVITGEVIRPELPPAQQGNAIPDSALFALDGHGVPGAILRLR